MIGKINYNTQRIFSALLLFILAAIYAKQIVPYTDIDLWDEANFLNQGIENLFSSGRFVYSLWYKFLHLFFADKIKLFYWNQIVLATLLPLAFFGFLTKVFDNLIIPFIFSTLFLYSLHNTGSVYEVANTFYYSNHHITHFTLMLFCFSMVFVKLKGINAQLLTLCFIFLVLGYTRQEYSLVFLIISIFTVVYFFRNKKHIPNKYFNILYSIIVIFVFLTLITKEIPFLDNDYSSLAYIMAYSTNYYFRHNLDFNQYSDIIKPFNENFKNTFGLISSFFSNPNEFILNIIFNIKYLITNIFTRSGDLFFPKILFSSKYKYCFNALAILMFLKAIYSMRKTNLKQIQKFYFTKKIYLISSLLLLFPTLFYSLIYYFDPKFYLFLIPIIIIIIAPFFNSNFKKVEIVFVILFFGFFIYIHPKYENQFTTNNIPVRKYIYNTYTEIEKIINKNGLHSIKVMAPYGDYNQFDKRINTISLFNYTNNKSDINQYNLDSIDVFIIDKDFIQTDVYKNINLDTALFKSNMKTIVFNDFMQTKIIYKIK